MNQKLRQIIAVALFVAVLGMSVNSIFLIAHEIEEAGFTVVHNISIGFLNRETPGHCPACPNEKHPASEHSHYSCDHHSPLCLHFHSLHLHPSLVEISRGYCEQFKSVPEVYQEIFIPPQIGLA